jgi:hypothetical protein
LLLGFAFFGVSILESRSIAVCSSKSVTRLGSQRVTQQLGKGGRRTLCKN